MSMLSSPTCSLSQATGTAWGLSPVDLHDHFWAARGVQVVRQGDHGPLQQDAEQFLLLDPCTMVVFRLRPLVDLLSWMKPRLLYLRVRNTRDRSYREIAVEDERGRFRAIRREYGAVDARVASVARVALTKDRVLAEFWRTASDIHVAWRGLRRRTARAERLAATQDAHLYDSADADDLERFARFLVSFWPHPGSVIRNTRKVTPGVWALSDFKPDPSVRFVGPVWVGAGRSIEPGQTVLGPAILWDNPDLRPEAQSIPLEEVEPMPRLAEPVRLRPITGLQRRLKRLFDIAFAVMALVFTLTLYPALMLAIWLEDGRPFFFAHRRESLGGREFPCIKFRSMRNDAEQIKLQLTRGNQADGPQFYMEQDPRVTRVGRFMRRLNLDELPQFLNVLLGHMSVVGPRPSPRRENQYCPAWREARLSVRPGITGLWQVMRTRRQGLDFQEWIRYDLEYVQNIGWRLDLWILWKTILMCLGKGR